MVIVSPPLTIQQRTPGRCVALGPRGRRVQSRTGYFGAITVPVCRLHATTAIHPRSGRNVYAGEESTCRAGHPGYVSRVVSACIRPEPAGEPPPPAHWTSRASGGQTGRRKCSRIEDRERRKPPSPGLRHPQTRFIRGLTKLVEMVKFTLLHRSAAIGTRSGIRRRHPDATVTATASRRSCHGATRPDAAVTAPLLQTQLTRQGIHP